MFTDLEISIIIIFYLIPALICLYNLFKKKEFKFEAPFYSIWLIFYCFIPFSNIYEMIRIIFKMQYDVETYNDLKKIPPIHYKLQMYLFIIGIVFSYFYLSQPFESIVEDNSGELIGFWSIAVIESGEIKGIDNKIRELLQGKRFWQNQLDEINHELKKALNEPDRQRREDEKMKQAVIEIERRLEEYYNKNPDKRPSSKQSRADELRAQANQIESNREKQLLEAIRLDRIAKLNKLLTVVQAKINEESVN